MRDLLYLAHRIPFPPNKGDKVRSFNQVKHLARHFRVHLGAFVDDPRDWQHVPELRKYCDQTYFASLVPGVARIKSLRGLLSGEALTLAYYRHRGLARWVARMQSTYPITHAVVYSSPMAQYVRKSDGLLRVADLVDVDSDKWRQYGADRPWPLSEIYAREARKLARFEREIAAEYDATLLVAPHEANLLRGMAPESARRIHHVCNGVDADFFSPQGAFDNPFEPADEAIVFTGAMDYWPNVDAVRWFASEVFPIVRRLHPRAIFCIVGARPTAHVLRLDELEGVRVTGGVPDVRPYLAHARLAVAPLRIARGVQNKVLEAMAMGKAVIASRHAAAGIDAREDRELVVAMGRDGFAAAVSHYLDSDTRHRIGTAARERVLASYVWSNNLRVLDSLLDASAARAPDSQPRIAALREVIAP
jgi:sugar transferase (PEP-CTERM/EpsH1 system associated)